MCVQLQASLSRGSRLSLDLEAGSPLIIIPQSARSNDMLVLDLGTLVITNTFLFSGLAGTLAANDALQLQPHETPQSATSPPPQQTDDAMMSSVYGDLTYDWRHNHSSDMIATSNVKRPQSLVSMNRDFDSDFRVQPFSVMSAPIRSSVRSTSFLSECMSDSVDMRTALASPVSTSPTTASFHSAVDTVARQAASPSLTMNALVEDSTVANGIEESSEAKHFLLDVMKIELLDTDVFSAERLTLESAALRDKTAGDYFAFPSFVIKRQVCAVAN